MYLGIGSWRGHLAISLDIYLIGRLYDLGIEPWRDVAWLPKNAATATRTPVTTSEFLSLATFVLIFIVMYLVIKIFNMVKNSEETGNETAVAENARANQRASTAARDSIIITPLLREFQISVFCGMIESSREHRQ